MLNMRILHGCSSTDCGDDADGGEDEDDDCDASLPRNAKGTPAQLRVLKLLHGMLLKLFLPF